MKEEVIVTDFGTVLQDAIDASKNDISLLTWKTKDGKEIKLVDLSNAELQKIYSHANEMLYNTSKYTPGKFQVKKNIQALRADCNAELFLRYLLYECNIEILKTNMQLITFIREHKSANNLSEEDSVSNLFTNLPAEFSDITIGRLMNACFDKLDVINRKMITDKFILAQGIWLTEDEKLELTERDSEGKLRPWLDVVRERLLLGNNVKLRVDPKGFSFGEFRSLVHLDPLPKISKLPSNTLRLLRDKVFILLDADVDYHIQKWLTIKENIEKVAQYKGFKLVGNKN